MEHLTDRQLLELLELYGDRPDYPPGHLDTCQRCREHWRELQESWQIVGRWTVDGSGIDLTDRILSQVDVESNIRLWQVRALIRIAASVIIGVGLGALIGRTGTPAVTAEQAMQAIYLDSLALHSSTGWTAPLLSEPEGP